MKLGLERLFSRRLLPVVFGLLMLWAIGGVVVAERVVARYDTAVGATLASVRELVALAREDVRREAYLLAHDPAVSDGMAQSANGAVSNSGRSERNRKAAMRRGSWRRSRSAYDIAQRSEHAGGGGRKLRGPFRRRAPA